MAETRITRITQLADIFTQKNMLLGDDRQSIYDFAVWLDKHKEMLFRKGATAVGAFKLYVRDNRVGSMYWTAQFADYVNSFNLHLAGRL